MNFIRQSHLFSRLCLTAGSRQFHGSRSVKNASPTRGGPAMHILLLGSPVSFLNMYKYIYMHIYMYMFMNTKR